MVLSTHKTSVRGSWYVINAVTVRRGRGAPARLGYPEFEATLATVAHNHNKVVETAQC